MVPDITRKPRLQFLDTGLLNYSLGHQSEMIGISDLNKFCRGRIIQHLVTQQLQAQIMSTFYNPVTTHDNLLPGCDRDSPVAP
jgi:hypothetical protein